MLIKSVTTTITGKQEKHDSELKEELDNLRKKFKIRDLKLDNEIINKKQYVKRSKSADLKKLSLKQNQNNRSSSADSIKSSKSKIDKSNKSADINFNDLLTNSSSRSPRSMESSRRASPSILKKSNSPRTRNEMMRKKVKFNSKNMYEGEDINNNSNINDKSKSDKQNAPKIDMNLYWMMSITYENENKIKNIKTIETYDKSIKNISKDFINRFELKSKKLQKTKEDEKKEEEKLEKEIEQREISPSNEKKKKSIDLEDVIYVFECKKWLAKDMDDKKIERVLKISSILRAK